MRLLISTGVCRQGNDFPHEHRALLISKRVSSSAKAFAHQHRRLPTRK